MNIKDFKLAPSGIGPLANEWKDKPHRLVYDLCTEVEELRKTLWLRHGCPPSGLYGDDEEMQCGVCGIDFKRAPIADIQQHWQDVARHIPKCQECGDPATNTYGNFCRKHEHLVF